MNERGQEMRYTYPIFLVEEDSGGYTVYLKDFDIATQGESVQDAIDMGADALWLMIDDYLQLDKPLPKPRYPENYEGRLIAVSVEVDSERGMLTTSMAAVMLGVSEARVRQMVCSGQLAAKKRGRDNYVYLWSVKERLAAAPKAGRPKKDKAVPAEA